MGRNAFSCDDVWSGAPLWHTSGGEVASVLGSLNLSGALGDHGSSASSSASTAEDSSAISALPALLPQAKEPRLPEPGSRDAEQVQINFAPQSTTGFAYDAASGTYGMLRADGTAQLDANTGAQAQFDNLLVLYSASSLRDDGTTLDYDLSLWRRCLAERQPAVAHHMDAGNRFHFCLLRCRRQAAVHLRRPQLHRNGVQRDRAGADGIGFRRAECAELTKQKKTI